MADKITVRLSARTTAFNQEIRGHPIKAVVEELRKQKVDRRRCAQDVLSKYALLIQGTARKNLNLSPTRIDEGTLRASIQTQIGSLFGIALGAIVFTDLEYAPYVHWGTGIHGENPEGGHRQTPWIYFDEKRKQFVLTSGMKPNPFLVEAFNEHAKEFLRELKACLKQP